MVKGHCDHKVAIRDLNDQIILDELFPDFSSAKSAFDLQTGKLRIEEKLTRLHGTGVIFKAPS